MLNDAEALWQHRHLRLPPLLTELLRGFQEPSPEGLLLIEVYAAVRLDFPLPFNAFHLLLALFCLPFKCFRPAA